MSVTTLSNLPFPTHRSMISSKENSGSLKYPPRTCEWNFENTLRQLLVIETTTTAIESFLLNQSIQYKVYSFFYSKFLSQRIESIIRLWFLQCNSEFCCVLLILMQWSYNNFRLSSTSLAHQDILSTIK